MLGGLSAMVPHRRPELAAIVLRAMIAGNVACFMTACIAGKESDKKQCTDHCGCDVIRVYTVSCEILEGPTHTFCEYTNVRAIPLMLLPSSVNTLIYNSRSHLFVFAPAHPVWIGPKPDIWKHFLKTHEKIEDRVEHFACFVNQGGFFHHGVVGKEKDHTFAEEAEEICLL